MIRIKGREEVNIQRQIGRYAFSTMSEWDSYLQDLLIYQFPNGLLLGQYSYPFSILLPSSMSASLILSRLQFIKYEIFAMLASNDQSVEPQMFKLLLHIREPPRGDLRLINLTKTE